MSKSEDYLDQLLSGLEADDKTQRPSPGSTDFGGFGTGSFSDDFDSNFGDDFGDDFKSEFDRLSEQDFLRDFEKSLEEDPFGMPGTESDEAFFSSLDHIFEENGIDENFDLGFDEKKKEPEEKQKKTISAPDSIPEDILNLLDEDGAGERDRADRKEAEGSGTAPEEKTEEPKPAEVPAGPVATPEDRDEHTIAEYGVGGEIPREELDNPAHQKKERPQEDEEEEIPDPAKIAAEAAAQSGIVDEESVADSEASEEDLMALLDGIGEEDPEEVEKLLGGDGSGEEKKPEEEAKEQAPEEREKLEGKFHTKKKREKKKRRTRSFLSWK